MAEMSRRQTKGKWSQQGMPKIEKPSLLNKCLSNNKLMKMMLLGKKMRNAFKAKQNTYIEHMSQRKPM